MMFNLQWCAVPHPYRPEHRADMEQNGKEAYEKVKTDMKIGNHFDIIFMDIQVSSRPFSSSPLFLFAPFFSSPLFRPPYLTPKQMPEMDGLESTRLIRDMGFTGPIIALSAFAEDGMALQCSEAGVDHYLR
jgi:osomolarity two-component system sensor histidine kinase SLN1